MKREVEILVAVETDIKHCLAALGKYTSQGQSHTIDTYYYDPARRTFQPDSTGRLHACLRTRSKAGVHSLTYKNDIFNDDGSWLYSEEFETKVDDAEALRRIVIQLGLRPLVTIDSIKHVFETDIYEIVLEEVTNLGLFLEVEHKDQVEERDAAAVKQAIRAFMTEGLGLRFGEELDAGKPELMLRAQKAQVGKKAQSISKQSSKDRTIS